MADENMVKIDLNTTVGVRAPGEPRARRYYGPGKGVEVPESVARSLGLVGVPVAKYPGTVGAKLPDPGDMGASVAMGDEAQQRATGAPTYTEPREEEQRGEDGGATGRYGNWRVDDLRDEAVRRGLEVRRSDGDGAPRKQDYVRALEEDDSKAE